MGGYDEHTPHIYTTTHTTEEHIIGLTCPVFRQKSKQQQRYKTKSAQTLFMRTLRVPDYYT